MKYRYIIPIIIVCLIIGAFFLKSNAVWFSEKGYREYKEEGDYQQALTYYKISAFLGNVDVYLDIADMFNTMEESGEYSQEAWAWLKKGGEKGCDNCFAEFANQVGFSDRDSAQKYWEKYFNSKTFNADHSHLKFELEMSNPVYQKAKYANAYLIPVCFEAFPLQHYDKLLLLKNEIEAMHNDAIRHFTERGNQKAVKNRQFQLDCFRELFK